jgi:branched-chain amino acid aminotransferase
MYDGAPRLCMVAPPVSDMLAAFDTLVREDQDWVPSAPGTALYIRPTLVATEAFLGVRPATRLTYFIIASPVGSYFAGGGLKSVRIWIETSEVRAPRGGLGGVKAGANYAASLHAATSARRVGYDQVLWLDARDHQYVEEVGTMNFFAVIDGTLVTPPLSDSILAGITRDSLLTLAADLGIPTEVRPLGLDELIAAHRAGTLTEAFGAGTAAVVSPISELGLDGASLSVGDGTPGPVARGLYAELTDIQRGVKPDRHGWLRVVV